jgi:hypothetical protein
VNPITVERAMNNNLFGHKYVISIDRNYNPRFPRIALTWWLLRLLWKTKP